MKKILLSFILAIAVAGFAGAQTTPSKPIQKSSKGFSKDTASVKEHGKLKKDGTPDKRYKENKGAPETPKKKDGTPDKRFKANKPETKKPATP